MAQEKEITLKAKTSKLYVIDDGRSFPWFSATWGRLQWDFYPVSGSHLTFLTVDG